MFFGKNSARRRRLAGFLLRLAPDTKLPHARGGGPSISRHPGVGLSAARRACSGTQAPEQAQALDFREGLSADRPARCAVIKKTAEGVGGR